MAAVCLGVLIAAIGSVPTVSAGATGGVVSPPEASMPWVAVHSIWFFSNRTEIDELEMVKLVALAAWVDTHAGSEVGISLPTGAVDPESARGRTSRLRVSAIREAMVVAGIPDSRIHEGAYGDPASVVDRRVVIFVRAEHTAVAASGAAP